LARKIFFERMKLKPRSRVAGLSNSIGDELLKVHVSYGRLVKSLLRRFNGTAHGMSPKANRQSRAIRAFAHITGGGFIDNIPRVLPKDCDAIIRKGSWEMRPIFQIIQAKGGVPEPELYQVFNMGIGMVVIVASQKAEAALGFIRSRQHRAWLIGEVVPGKGRAKII
ncbi:MAG: phosphoribosylformylglycinamidine cyclo-ligase, partial [Verrucomicrobia bacterium]|nr:phosphoribosylformylglycinamidine cyclo-ligase [Verrucomicrobiota bacterium]